MVVLVQLSISARRTAIAARRIAIAVCMVILSAAAMLVVVPDASAAEPEVPCTGFLRTPHDTFDDSGKISVSPPSREFELEPGDVVRRCLLVSNRTSSVQQMRLSPIDIEASEDGDAVLRVVPGGSGGFGLASWIDLEQSSISLNPGDDVTVPFTVTVPADAPIGTSMGGIAVAGSASAGSEVGFQGRLVSQILVTVPGDRVTKVEVGGVSSPRLLNHGDIGRFEFTASNDGTVIDHVRGTVIITSTLGGRRVVTLRSEEGRVLRGGKRSFTLRWIDTPWIGRYEPELIVTSDGGKVRQTLPAIWVIPPWTYVIAVLVAVLLPTVIAIYRRWRMNRELLRMIMEEDLDGDLGDLGDLDELGDLGDLGDLDDA